MGASENFDNLTEEQIAQWENEGGNTMAEKRSEQKTPSHSPGSVFLQERFLKAVLAQTILDNVSWRQTGSGFQYATAVYFEIWETCMNGYRVVYRYQEVLRKAIGSFKKIVLNRSDLLIDHKKDDKPSIDIMICDQETICSLSLNDTMRQFALQLHGEIKEQQNRIIREWRNEGEKVKPDFSVKTMFASALQLLTQTLGMKKLG